MCEGMKRIMGVFLMLFFFFLFLPNSAYAADNLAYRYDGVVYGPSYVVTSLVTSDYNSKQWVIVNAPDKFSAAVYAVGGNPVDLDSTKKALLSNASTGGDFYTFSSLFVNLGGSFDYPSWMGGAEKSIYRSYEGMYGEDNVYVAAFTPAQQYGASSDYGVIAGGGNIGGGSGGGVGGNVIHVNGYYLYPLQDWMPSNYDWKQQYIAVPDAKYAQLVSGYSSPVVFATVTARPSTTAGRLVSVLAVDADCYGDWLEQIPGTEGTGSDYVYQYRLAFSDSNGIITTRPNHRIIFNYSVTTTTTIDGKSCYDLTNASVSSNSNIGRINNGSYPNQMAFNYWPIIQRWSADLSSNPSVPETNWPVDDNVASTPPDIPEPQEPVIDNQPAQPTPETTPVYPTYTTVTVNNFTADLQGILDAMDEHCIHLQNAIWWNFNQFWQKLSTKLTNDFATMRTFLSQQFSWIVSSIDSMFESLKDYLEDLAEWLRDELNYTISGASYDDNTLLSWLKKIYYKLGNGNVSTKPVDPNANPDGVGDWISQLLANLFTALDDLAGGLLTSLATLIGGLVTKFPFSIPWDVAAILGLLVATPQAPNFDVPVYVFNGTQLVQAGTYEIDLDAWTPYLTGIHMMIKVSFILFLLLKTKDFMSIMEKAVGLGA